MDMGLAQILKAEYGDIERKRPRACPNSHPRPTSTYIAKLETEMREAAKKFEFEKAAKLRDTIKELREQGIPLQRKQTSCQGRMDVPLHSSAGVINHLF